MAGLRAARVLPVLALGLVCAGWAQAQGRPGAGPASRRVRAVPLVEPAQIGAWLQRLPGRYKIDGSVEVRMRATTEPPPSGGDTPPPSLADLVLERMRTESGQSDILDGTPVRGLGDCVAVGDGDGVQCVLNVTWQELREEVVPSQTERGGVFNLPGGVSNLAPAMALFGLDPRMAEVRYLLVDSAGLAEGESGGVIGDQATFKTPCANAAAILNGLRPPPIPTSGQLPPPPPPTTCDKTIRLEALPNGRIVYLTIAIELDGETKTTYVFSMRRMPAS